MKFGWNMESKKARNNRQELMRITTCIHLSTFKMEQNYAPPTLKNIGMIYSPPLETKQGDNRPYPAQISA